MKNDLIAMTDGRMTLYAACRWDERQAIVERLLSSRVREVWVSVLKGRKGFGALEIMFEEKIDMPRE